MPLRNVTGSSRSLFRTLHAGGCGRYVRARALQRMGTGGTSLFRSKAWAFFFWVPQGQTSDSIRDRIRIWEDLERLGVRTAGKGVDSWAGLWKYRTLVAERLSQPAWLVVREAESIYRRRLFALGVASASMLVAVQGLARTVLELLSQHVPKTVA